jgi:hypothetical protein
VLAIKFWEVQLKSWYTKEKWGKKWPCHQSNLQITVGFQYIPDNRNCQCHIAHGGESEDEYFLHEKVPKVLKELFVLKAEVSGLCRSF